MESGVMELVKQAPAAYDAGRDREWAGALWMAGEQAVYCGYAGYLPGYGGGAAGIFSTPPRKTLRRFMSRST